MPDGFDPHREIERIYTLKDLMSQCRERLPTIMSVLDQALQDENAGIRLQAAQMALDRGFGKPRQTLAISPQGLGDASTQRVVVLPDNGRVSQPVGPVIDVEQ